MASRNDALDIMRAEVKRKGLNTRTIAGMLEGPGKCSHTTVNRLLRGKPGVKWETVLAVASALGLKNLWDADDEGGSSTVEAEKPLYGFESALLASARRSGHARLLSRLAERIERMSPDEIKGVTRMLGVD
jgi:hypothetical protein